MEPLSLIEKEMKKCVKCGACRAHCPAFSVLGREPATARGKIALARGVMTGTVPLDARTRADMSTCLLCGGCVEKCANDVPTDLIVLAAREVLARKRGLTPLSRMIRLLFGSRKLMNGCSLAAKAALPLLFRRIPASSGLRLRFPFRIFSGRRIPAMPRRPFLDRHQEVTEGRPDRPRVAYFVGCMTNFMYPQIGEAALDLLKELGCTVIIPKDQQCCGFPAISGGDFDTFRFLAEKNLAALEKCAAEVIVTACASCGGAFHRLYPRVLGERLPGLASRCEALAEKTVDAAVLLQRLGFEPAANGSGSCQRVFYHDPCHLRNRSILREPRHLLRSLPGLELVDAERAASCCGLGGTFNYYHYRTSMEINAGRMAAIADSKADTVATGCPGCMMQIADGLSRGGSGIRVRHLLEILAEKSPGNR